MTEGNVRADVVGASSGTPLSIKKQMLCQKGCTGAINSLTAGAGAEKYRYFYVFDRKTDKMAVCRCCGGMYRRGQGMWASFQRLKAALQRSSFSGVPMSNHR